MNGLNRYPHRTCTPVRAKKKRGVKVGLWSQDMAVAMRAQHVLMFARGIQLPD